MDYTSYQSISDNSQSLNTGSYLNSTEYAMFVNGFTNDLWYGLSAKDVVEIGVWDRAETQIGWNILYQSKSYDTVTISYFDTLNNAVTYSFQELKPEFILNQAKKLLVAPEVQVSSSFNIGSGSFNLTYNLTRQMAGSPSSPLVIKDIASSRKEVKLFPVSIFDDSYTSFCQHKMLMNDVSSLYVKSLDGCPYGQIYNTVAPIYPTEISTIKHLFFISSDGGMLTFFRNIYEDILMYSYSPIVTTRNNPPSHRNQTHHSGSQLQGSQNFIRIQGIRTYFNNYLLSNSNVITDFDTMDSKFSALVSASVERKFASAGQNPSHEYIDAKAFVYDYFTKYFYTPITNALRSAYNDKYFGYFKNALNVGDNRLLPILSTGMMDERTSPEEPFTLLVKLKDELPTDIPLQTQCWVSNISLVPQIVSSIIINNVAPSTYKIGPPNFSIPIPDASLTNTNLSYTANDLQLDSGLERQITISQNINELSVDYTDFNNFVLFSSAEMRLKIFKNKIINLCGLSASLETLNSRASNFLIASGSIYPYYDTEYASIQEQTDKIINTFDGYESYLYNNGQYAYQNGTFINAIYVSEQDAAATAYDKDNRDSLINTCPEHLLTNSDNDDYIIFISMVGHFFDNIYIYISNMPSEKKIGNNSTSEFTRRVVDYMLETFGWKLDDSLEQTDLLNNYLNNDQLGGLNGMSAEERLKTIRNRLLQNLPSIYKSKGTDEAVQLILSCYGIPSTLLSVREYGGVDYDDPQASYTHYERVYMRQWDTSSKYDTYELQIPSGSHTYLFKMSIDDSTPYMYGKEQFLFGRVEDSDKTSLSGSGEWAVGFVRTKHKNSGQIFFRIGYKDQEKFKIYSPEVPIFDGNIYSIMLRRNQSDYGFEFTTNYNAVPSLYELYIKRNQFGTNVIALSSSAVCYDVSTNTRFDQGGHIKIGGWFADYNGQGFTGAFDKFQAWLNPIANEDLEDYTNNFSAYASRGSGSVAYESLFFRMHTDYPFNQRENGIWRNGNPYFAVSSSTKLNILYGEPNCNVDYIICSNPWSGSTVMVQGQCGPESQSVYPWQWKAFDYPSTWGISKYGPNKFRNEKIKFISQSLDVRLDNLNRSTFNNPNGKAPDSNQVGFYIDPQDFKNRDIVRYFGNYDFMDAIGDPGFQYSQSYDPLRLFRKEFAEDRNQLSGSRTLFNELLTTYKLYFNRSVFDSIKNVVPARTNALIGVVIEPTILERPKYPLKVINSSADYASEVAIDKIVRMTSSLIPSRSMDLDVGYISHPTRDYPVNYGGNYISDLTDPFEFGHFAAGVPSRVIDFTACPLNGTAPLMVQFTNLSYGASKYLWDYGDNSTDYTPQEDVVSGKVSPIHQYQLPGVYTVTLVGYYGQYGLTCIKPSYISVGQYDINADFDANPKTGFAPLNVSFSNFSVNGTTYVWDFGSGSATSTNINPTQSYSTPGSYTVTLTAYTQLNQSNVCGGLPFTSSYSTQHISTSYITVMPQLNTCNGPYLQSFAGGMFGKYPFAQQYNYGLGSLQTPVTFSYNAGASASRFIVSINNVTQYDSLWASTPGAGLTMVNTINKALRTYGSIPSPSYISASISNVVDHQNNVALYFNKTLPSSITTVTVYNPFNTTCSFTMSCPTLPAPPPLVTNAPTTYSCGTAVTSTSDVNGNPFPFVFGVKFTNSDDDMTMTWTSNNPIRIVTYYSGTPQLMTSFGSQYNYNGWLCGDSGYCGSVSQQGVLNSALAAQGQNPQYIQHNGTTGVGVFSFLEHQFWGGNGIGPTVVTPPRVLKVEVYAPIPNTKFTITVGCPF